MYAFGSTRGGQHKHHSIFWKYVVAEHVRYALYGSLLRICTGELKVLSQLLHFKYRYDPKTRLRFCDLVDANLDVPVWCLNTVLGDIGPSALPGS